ncbi:MAG: hypothetical protein ACREDR_45095, partial [Blastocatellia bacterium]
MKVCTRARAGMLAGAFCDWTAGTTKKAHHAIGFLEVKVPLDISCPRLDFLECLQTDLANIHSLDLHLFQPSIPRPKPLRPIDIFPFFVFSLCFFVAEVPRPMGGGRIPL